MSDVSFRWHILPAIFNMVCPKIGARRATAPIKSIVCLRPGKLGDMIAATPLFSSIKQWGSVERLAVLCSEKNEVVIRHNPHIDDIRIVNFHRPGEVLAAVRWLRRRRFDSIMDLTPGFSRTNFFIVRFAGATVVRAGINKGTLSPHYHSTVEENDTHIAERMLKLGAAVVGKTPPGTAPMRIFCSVDNTRAAEEFVSRHSAGVPLIAVNLSAGHENRQWACERYRALCAMLSSQLDGPYRIALISFGDKRPWAERLTAEFPRCLAVPQCPFLTVVALLAHCRLLVSPDTALIHAAAAQGIPVVGLYPANKENLARWRPYRIRCAVIQSSNIDTITDIEPETVYAATRRLMTELEAPAGNATSREPV